MKSRIHFSSVTDVWSTPQAVYNELHKEFSFDFDPCPINPTFDGLNVEWGGATFCNPPYSNLKAWIKKGYEEHLKGKTVVFLIPSRTDTKAWHDYVMKSHDIRFIKGRLKFGDSKSNAPFPSVVVVFKS